MEPAKTIIEKFGGEAAVSRITGTAFTAPYRWQHARAKGGTDGRIPQKHIGRLLAHARDNGIDVSAQDFLVADVESTSLQVDAPAPVREGAAA